MQSGYKEINEKALTVLKNEDFDKAQELFRASAKHYPNGCTLNNLGVFYCYCGIRQKNGKQVSAWAQGVKYLRQAAARERKTAHAVLRQRIAEFHYAPVCAALEPWMH